MAKGPLLAPGSDSEGALNAIAAEAVRQTPMFFGVYDTQLRACFLNAAGRAMIGLSSSSDIAAYRIADFFVAEDRVLVEEVVIPTLLRYGDWSGERCFRHFTDPVQQTEVRWSVFALHEDGGHLTGVAALITDISARRQTERELRDQQVLLASVLDDLPLGVGVYDGSGNLTHSNQRMRDFAGLAQLPSRDPALLNRWRGYDPDGRPIPPERYPGARALSGERVTPGMDFLYSGRESLERWMRISAVPFRPRSDEVDGAIVVVQDVDDLKRSAERIEAVAAELALQSRFVEATLSSIPDFVYAFDRQHRFVYANSAMLSLFGLSAYEMLGKEFLGSSLPN